MGYLMDRLPQSADNMTSPHEGYRDGEVPKAHRHEPRRSHGTGDRLEALGSSEDRDGPERARGGREPTVSVRVLAGLVRALERGGATRDALQQGTSIDLGNIDGDGRVARSEIARLCEVALTVTDDPALGLHCAERISPVAFGPLSHMIAHSATLKHALEALGQFHRLLNDEPSFKLIELDGRILLEKMPRAGEPPRMQRFFAEISMVGLFRLVRAFGRALPESASFAFARPPHAAEYTRLFEGRERFEQPFTGIVFDKAWLSAPSPDRDEEVHATLRGLAERRLMRIMQRTPYALRVREFLLRQDSWRHRVDMPAVARSLGISVRSLRRRLAHEQTSYTVIANEALAVIAKQLLSQQRTIQETAYEMGFADTSSFHRAFKQWTGTTPSAYRETQLVHDERP